MPNFFWIGAPFLINLTEVRMNLFRNQIDEFTIILFPDHLASRELPCLH